MADILTIRRLAEPVQAALRERARRAGRSDGWLEGLRECARRRTGGRGQTDSAELVRQGRDGR